MDISFTVCVFVRLRISPSRIEARGVKVCSAVHRRLRQGISHFCINFATAEAQNQTNRPARGPRPPACKHYRRDAPT